MHLEKHLLVQIEGILAVACHAEGNVVDQVRVGVDELHEAREVVDLGGAFVGPGFIDAHVHVESAMVPPREFASVVLPHGVTSIVADPHEIANVLGLDGIRFMIHDAAQAPLNVFVNASSCVPATHLATAGAELTAADLAALLERGEVLGLAEVMNYPGVIAGEKTVVDKILAFEGRPIDGHSPGLEGRALNAYVAAGIRSDHECTTAEEARRKTRLGMTVFIREGTAAHNLAALVPAVTPANERRFCFCSDDRHIIDLIEQGSIDHMVRCAVERGLDPVTAIRMGSLNVAEHFRLHERGAVAPGRIADLVVFRDLRQPRAERVYADGRLVAREGTAVGGAAEGSAGRPAGTVRVDWSRVGFDIPASGDRVRAIGIVPDQLVTEHRIEECTVEDGRAQADPGRDLLKMAVIERHGRTGNVGLGFVKGLGLRRGAIAGTVAHDHHNLVVIGADDASMMTAARAAAEAGGGLAAAEGTSVRALLALPIAGLMTDRPAMELASELREVVGAARDLGSRLHDPFMTMSFLSLEVIPSLKLTDRGLVDVERMDLVPLFVESAGGRP